VSLEIPFLGMSRVMTDSSVFDERRIGWKSNEFRVVLIMRASETSACTHDDGRCFSIRRVEDPKDEFSLSLSLARARARSMTSVHLRDA